MLWAFTCSAITWFTVTVCAIAVCAIAACTSTACAVTITFADEIASFTLSALSAYYTVTTGFFTAFAFPTVSALSAPAGALG